MLFRLCVLPREETRNLALWSLIRRGLSNLYDRILLSLSEQILNQLLDVPLQGSAIKQRYATAFRQKW